MNKALTISFVALLALFCFLLVAAITNRWDKDSDDDFSGSYNDLEDVPQIIYGELYFHDDVSPLVVSVTNNSYYFDALGFSEGLSQGMVVNASAGSLTVEVDGVYLLSASISFGDGAAEEFQVAAKINGVEMLGCEAHRVLGTGGDVGNLGLTCLLSLVKDDVLTVGFQDEAAPASDANIYSANINLVRITP